MPKKIQKLTPQQQALLPAVRDEWLAHGLSTTPADRPTAEAGVAAAYRAAGLEPPAFIIWLGSPWAGAVGQAVAPEIVGEGLRRLGRAQRGQVGGQVDGQVDGQVYGQVGGQVYGQVDDQVDGQVRDQVYGQVYGQVYDQVRDQVYDQVYGQVDDQVYGQVDGQVGGQVRGQVYGQVGDQVRGQVDGQVGDQVGDQVYGQVRDQVGDQVDGQVDGQVGDQVRGQVDGQVYGQVRGREFKNRLSGWWRGRIMGQHWAGYYSYYDAMERIGVTGLEPIHGAQQVARSAGWWWCFRDFAILTERPSVLHRDQLGRLHCETGPAIAYPDGWNFYVWHGHRVQPWVVLEPTVERIAREANAEDRRCAIESMGWDRFIAAAELTPVDRCADPGNDGHELALYDVSEEIWGERVRVLLCTNGTIERDGVRRRFGLTVPDDTPTALHAAAWGYGISVREYAALEVRR